MISLVLWILLRNVLIVCSFVPSVDIEKPCENQSHISLYDGVTAIKSNLVYQVCGKNISNGTVVYSSNLTTLEYVVKYSSFSLHPAFEVRVEAMPGKFVFHIKPPMFSIVIDHDLG